MSNKPPKERGLSASQRAEAHLRRAIDTGKLRPRQRIIEEDLAHELGVSRGPVREALLRLERDGLVVTTSRRGTFVRDISMFEIATIFRMRAKLEGLCVRFMREDADPRSGELLEQCLQRLRKATTKNNEEQFFESDMELHRTIWKCSNRPLLYRTLATVMNPFIFMIAREHSSRTPMHVRCENHEQYVQIVLNAPLGRVERDVERYFDRLFRSVFRSGPLSSHYSSEEWPEMTLTSVSTRATRNSNHNRSD